ncbi:hypothetical protein D3Z50_10995 [Clostridiaceae bacterium]|nr:hypothetical protein [Clostridiaceae bacterium]
MGRQAMKFFKNRRVKGAVSIFLVIILIPTMLLSAVLIDGARMQSARAMTQEAADLAAASALAAYHVDLKEAYGLFAMADKDEAEAIYKESLSATLMASGITDDADYADRIWEILKSQAGLGNPYKGQDFLNLYDFRVDEAAVTPMYSLANTAVLENQMVEYAKYRGVYIAADRMELISKFSQMKKQAEENARASEVMEKRMEVDEQDKAETEIDALNKELDALHARMVKVTSLCKEVFQCFEARMKELQIEAAGSDETMTGEEQNQAGRLERVKQDFAAALGDAVRQAETTAAQAETAGRETEGTIGRLEEFAREHRGEGNETVRELVKDAEEEIEKYRSEYLEKVNTVKEDPVLNQLKGDQSLKADMERLLRNITEAIEAYQKELEEQEDMEEDEDGEEEGGGEEEEEEIEYFYYFLHSSARTPDAHDVLYRSGSGRYQWECVRRLQYMRNAFPPDSADALEDEDSYFRNLRVPFLGKSEGEEAEKNGNKLQGRAEKNEKADESGQTSNESVSRGTVPDDIYQSRPSKTFDAAAESASYGGLVGGDVQAKEDEALPDGGTYYSGKNLDASKSAIKGASSSFLLDLGEMARDDALILSYMFGTFKTRLTGDPKFTSSDGEAGVYMPKWRIREGGETDIRFQPKKDRKTVLRGEIEYLVYGLQSDQGNEDAVYATILAERLANNMIALYQNKTIKGICKTASRAAAVASVVVPSPVWFWIFLTAWAVAETYMDMHYLVQEGYRIPLFKTKENLLLADFKLFLDENGAVENYGDPDEGIFVTYEDYLLILLIIKGNAKRVMRAADLIEMNMRQSQADFRMSEAFTCLRAGTSLSIRYLFGGVGPFGTEYGKNGLTGRMRFEHTIYQSY